jgi:rhodanese-related sulfurtransferase
LAKKKTPSGAFPKKNQKRDPKSQIDSKSSRRPSTPSKKAVRRKEAEKREIPWFIVGVVSFIIVILAVLIFYRFATGMESQAGLSPEISPQEAHQKYLQGAFLLDVREQEEWDEYHVPNTTHIPLGELGQRLAELPRDKEIVVVCRTGNRSQEGRDILLNAGFKQVTSMTGGVSQWETLNFPITRNTQ